MKDITRRLNKAEKALNLNEKPYPVNIAGIEIMSDELDKLIKKIWAKSKGLPIREGTAV